MCYVTILASSQFSRYFSVCFVGAVMKNSICSKVYHFGRSIDVLPATTYVVSKIYCILIKLTAFCHGFSFMDKQLLLTAVRFTQCRLVPYIANTMLYWQHFSRLVSAVPGCSVEHGFTYLDLHWIQLFRIIRNFLKLLKTHHSQPLLEV